MARRRVSLPSVAPALAVRRLASLGDAVRQIVQIRPDDGCKRGVRDRRRRALVLAKGREDLVARDDGDVEFLAEDSRRTPFVLRVSVRVEEGDRDRLGVDLRGQFPECRRVDWAFDPVRRRALGDLVPPLGRDQRRWPARVEVVKGGPRLSADCQHVAEALGSHQRRLGDG